jgi:hypothetical protein
MEFPFGSNAPGRSRQPPFEWEIRLSNFLADAKQRESWPVRVERVFLSSDNKNLVGAIAVQNLAFQKLVVARFTLDYWKTTSEVAADYNHDVRRRQNCWKIGRARCQPWQGVIDSVIASEARQGVACEAGRTPGVYRRPFPP